MVDIFGDDITRELTWGGMHVDEFVRIIQRKKAKNKMVFLEGRIREYETAPSVHGHVVKYLTGEIQRQLPRGGKGAKLKRANDRGT